MYIFIHTETTGLPKKWDAELSDSKNWPRMIQLSWVVYDEFENKINFGDYLIKPKGFIIPKWATEIHGISTKNAKENGAGLLDVLNEINLQIDNAKFIVGYFINFNLNILGSELLRNKLEFNVKNKNIICILENRALLFPSKTKYLRSPYVSLEKIYKKLFNIDISENLSYFERLFLIAKCFFEMKRLNLIEELKPKV